MTRDTYCLCRSSASASDIEQHLRDCDAGFVAGLQTRGPLRAYCGKLAELAARSEVWVDGRLVALCAYYNNRPKCRTGFISNVSVVADCLGEGLGRVVVEDALACLAAAGFASVELEVDADNQIALNLYARLGFDEVRRTRDGALILRRALSL